MTEVAIPIGKSDAATPHEAAMTAAESSVILRCCRKGHELIFDYARSLHLPNLSQGCGVGIVSTLLPIYARHLGASDAMIGAIVSANSIGKVFCDVPASIMVHEHSVRLVMVGANVMHVCGTLLAWIAPSADFVLICAGLWGGSIAVYFVARNHFLADSIAKETRGRLFSVMGGVLRWAMVIGPLIGGVAADFMGARNALLVTIPFIALTAFCSHSSERIRSNDEKQRAEREEARKQQSEGASHKEHRSGVTGHLLDVWDTATEHYKAVLSVGVFAGLLASLRICRRLFLPLAAMNLNLPATQVGLILTVSFLVDASFFWIGGIIVDKYGRKASAIPTALLLALAFVFLSSTTTAFYLWASALFFGLSGCVGSGVILTLIADVAPQKGSKKKGFMGAMRLVQDLGGVVGPMLAGVMLHFFDFRNACLAVGGIGFFAAGWCYFLVEETHGASDIKTASPQAGSTEFPTIDLKVEDPRKYSSTEDLVQCE